MDNSKHIKKSIQSYLYITAAAFIYSAGISLFLDPNGLAPGGMSGLAIICSHITGWKTGTWFFLFNIPVVALGIWKFGVKFILSTFYAVAAISACTNLFSRIGSVTGNPLLASITGAFLVAVGMGIIFKAGATTGGTDIIVKLLRIRFSHLKTGKIFLMTDAVIVTLSGIIFRDLDKALFAGIAVLINSFILDMVLYGKDEAKLVYIISDSARHITDRVLRELEIGVTYLKGQGAYTNTEKQVILCVLKKRYYPRLEEIVKQTDPGAFLIISSANEIYGEGYKNIYGEKL